MNLDPEDLYQKYNERPGSEESLDLLFETFHIWIIEDELDKINCFISVVTDNLNTAHIDLLLGVLTCSLPRKSKIVSRSKFFDDVEAKLKLLPEWSENLLLGLK